MVWRIVMALYLAFKKEINAILKERRTARYMNLWSEKWNADLVWISKQIENEMKYDSHAEFNWNQLVMQEINMWAIIAEPVSSEQVEGLCERRGFSMSQKQYLIDMLLHMNLLER